MFVMEYFQIIQLWENKSDLYHRKVNQVNNTNFNDE